MMVSDHEYVVVSVKLMMWSCDGSLEVEEMADLLT